MDILIGIIGLLASVCGLLVGGIQTLRIRNLKREENADVWLTIRILKNIFYHLDKDNIRDENSNVARAYEAALSIFRTQLKRAVMNETNYTLETIEKWKSVKKISSDWQEKQALGYLQTENIAQISTSEQGASADV